MKLLKAFAGFILLVVHLLSLSIGGALYFTSAIVRSISYLLMAKPMSAMEELKESTTVHYQIGDLFR